MASAHCLLFSDKFDLCSFVKRLMWFLRRFHHIRYVESGSFRHLIEFFQLLMFVFVTIKDLKYYMQRDAFSC